MALLQQKKPGQQASKYLDLQQKGYFPMRQMGRPWQHAFIEPGTWHGASLGISSLQRWRPQRTRHESSTSKDVIKSRWKHL